MQSYKRHEVTQLLIQTVLAISITTEPTVTLYGKLT